MASNRPMVEALDRALSILDVLRLADVDLVLRDIALRTGLPKSTTQQLLSTLKRRGLVARDHIAGTYRLATKTFHPVGTGPGVSHVPQDLAARSGEAANLGALIGSEVLYVNRADSPHALRWQLGVGSRRAEGLGGAVVDAAARMQGALQLRRLTPSSGT